MEYLPFGSFIPSGDLDKRLKLSIKRLSADEYAYPKSYNDGGGWPGDWPGRAMLGQILLARATGIVPSSLEENLRHLPELMNVRGYAGEESDLPNEQQLSGNSWLLRALCELYEWRKEESVLLMIRNMVKGLYLPLKGKYTVYPRTKESRITGTGEASGQTTGEIINGWILSSDIGCSFIPLDGMTHAYRVTRDPALFEVITEAIAAFRDSDLLAATFQTHATLSALRGILRFSEDTDDPALVAFAEDIFELYRKKGMTETYANQNWFLRPEWTEPCAIIDSFIVSMQLNQATGSGKYQALAEKIWFNAVSHAQRPNGGFGCDSCSGERLISFPNLYEASWCCTMRGGEGLARAAEYAVGIDGDDVVISLPFPGEYKVGKLHFILKTDYPRGEKAAVNILENPEGKRIRVLCGGESISVEKPEFTLPSPLGFVPALFEDGKVKIMRGPVIYAYDGKMEGKPEGLHPLPDGTLADKEGRVFRPLSSSTYTSREEILASDLQILF